MKKNLCIAIFVLVNVSIFSESNFATYNFESKEWETLNISCDYQVEESFFYEESLHILDSQYNTYKYNSGGNSWELAPMNYPFDPISINTIPLESEMLIILTSENTLYKYENGVWDLLSNTIPSSGESLVKGFYLGIFSHTGEIHSFDLESWTYDGIVTVEVENVFFLNSEFYFPTSTGVFLKYNISLENFEETTEIASIQNPLEFFIYNNLLAVRY